jgi:type IV pilus assembly protein PilN
MIRINLLPVRELKAEVGRRQDLVIAGVCLGLTLVCVLAVYLFQYFRVSSLEKEHAALRTEIETLNAQTKEVAELETKIRDVKEKLKAIDQLSGKKTGPVQVMESLTAAVPPRLWLTEFVESGGNLSIVGYAIDNPTIADFLKALSNLPYFKNVDLVEAVQDEQQGMKKFTLRAAVSYVPVVSPPDKAGTPQAEKKEGK